MNRAVLISIQPKWCAMILNGKKTIEVRKNRPKLETPFKCYIYETKGKIERPRGEEGGYIYQEGRGAVVGEFVCDTIFEIKNVGNAFKVGKTPAETNRVARASCLDFGDMHDYLGHKGGYGWHISDLKIYDDPLNLKDLPRDCSACGYVGARDGNCDFIIKRPPQSWCYVRCAPDMSRAE